MVTARKLSEQTYAEQMLLRALLISLLIHVGVYGTWRWGKNAGWWQHVQFPHWLKLTPALMTPLAPKKSSMIPPPRPQPAQLVFVDVDPALADAAPPKKPKYYSANNSSAGNPHPKNMSIPEIEGRQKHVMKTTEDAKLKPEPLRPSPPKPKQTLQPAPKPVPQKALTPGDFAMAKPRPVPQEKNGEAAVENNAETQPQPVEDRPRTIADAKARHGMTEEKMKQDGGVGQLKMDSTLDAVKTAYGDYDREFIDAVRSRWFQLLEDRTVDGSGKVVVEFRLLPDGRVTNLKMTENEMTDLLGLLCQRAIYDPAPFRKWPIEMQRDFPQGFRDVTFTFYYSTE